MKPYEPIDISGDAGIRAYGETLEEAFVNAATGMFSLMTSLEGINERRAVDLSLESGSLDGLLVSWLNELIFRFDAYGFVGRKITLQELTHPGSNSSSFKLRASISGEDFDPERHESKLLIKAATYHGLKIEKTGDVWQIDVIFDI